MSELCLGTVQLGMDYGIHGRSKPSLDESLRILDLASNSGIAYLDTAFAYSSETVVCYRSSKFKIISKAPPEKLVPNPNLLGECRDSCKRLGVSSLDGYLFHTSEYVYETKLVSQLFSCKSEGHTKNVGVSVYNLPEALKAIDIGLDYIQFPYSVLDRRFEKESFFERAYDKGITLFARSPFIQGLLTGDEIPDWLDKSKPFHDRFKQIISRHNFTKVSAALLFSVTHPNIDFTVFGVHDTGQLSEDLTIAKTLESKFSKCREELARELLDIPESIVVPSLWKRDKQ